MQLRALGVFGGTFDPIHFGHLRIALDVKEALSLDEIRFIPNAVPPHREPSRADSHQRLTMLRLATADEPGFVVDDREINRGGLSYTVDTLKTLRDDFPESSVSMLLGSDAFSGLTSWHRWNELFDLAHIIVMKRPGWMPPQDGALGDVVQARVIEKAEDLHVFSCGKIYFCPVTQLAISSTDIRERLGRGHSPSFLLPSKVVDYITKTQIYA